MLASSNFFRVRGNLSPLHLSIRVAQSQLAGIGILLALVVVWVAARRDGYGAAWPLATLAIGAVGAVIGGRAWALAEWWLRDGASADWIWNPLAPAGYASAGALLGAGLAMLVHRVAFGSDATARVLDVIVPSGFVALATTRLGCVPEGCDVGSLTDAAWAVAYPAGHRVWHAQVDAEIIGAGAAWSAGVHPFGLYLAVPTFLIAVGSVAWRPRCAGGRALVVVAGYAVVRLIVEFFRAAPSSLHLGFVVAIATLVVAVAWWAVDRHSSCREVTNG